MSKGHSQKKQNKEEILLGVDPSAISDRNLQESHADLMERKEEPAEGFSGVPIFMLFLMSALLFVGGIYMVHFAAGYDFLAYDETYVPVGDDGDPPPPPPLFEIGAAVYAANCVACHQANGEGLPGVFPPLSGTEWVTGSKDRLARVVLHGLMGPIEVKGNTYNGVMPPFGTLPDLQMAGVLTYIRQAWDDDASDVTPEEVAAVRAAEAGRTQPWTAPQLEPFAE